MGLVVPHILKVLWPFDVAGTTKPAIYHRRHLQLIQHQCHSIHNTEYWLQEFREEFDKFGLLLTAPLRVMPDMIEHSYDIPAVSQYLHYMFALCFAYYGWMAPTGLNAPLYPRYDDDKLNVVRIDQVCSKLVLSKPFCLCLCYCNSVILYMTQNSLVCIPLKELYNSFTVL